MPHLGRFYPVANPCRAMMDTSRYWPYLCGTEYRWSTSGWGGPAASSMPFAGRGIVGLYGGPAYTRVVWTGTIGTYLGFPFVLWLIATPIPSVGGSTSDVNFSAMLEYRGSFSGTTVVPQTSGTAKDDLYWQFVPFWGQIGIYGGLLYPVSNLFFTVIPWTAAPKPPSSRSLFGF